MTVALNDVARSATVTIEGLRLGPTTGTLPEPTLTEPPSLVERIIAFITLLVAVGGLPIDWFQTNEQYLAQDGNLRAVVIELALMTMAVARIAGYLNWVIRAIRLDGYLFAFATLTVVSTIWSADAFETFKQSLIFFTTTLFGVYLILRFTLHEIIMMAAKAYTVVAVASLGLALVFPGFAIDEGLWDGVYFHKNGLGTASMIAIPILIIAAREGGRGRHIYYFSLGLTAFLLFMSQSKTMLVAAVASTLLLGLFQLFRGSRTLRGAVIVGVMGSALVTVGLVTLNLGVLTDFLDRDVTLTGRIPLWESLIPVILERPITGHGYKAAFGGWFSPVHDVWLAATWGPKHAHNAVIQIWVDLGLVGVVIFVIQFFRAASRALTVTATSSGLVGLWPLVAISSALLVSITERGVIASGWLMYVVAALSAALYTQSSR